jgi:hypothetical protein
MGCGPQVRTPEAKGKNTMAGTYILRRKVAMLNDLKGGMAAFGLGVGNVYYVIKTTEAHYTNFVHDYQTEYTDGSLAVHTTIQSALDATVDSRNDYVVVMPSGSDYDLTTALTLTKKAVHLVAPSGYGYSIGASNGVRVHQTGAYPIAVVSNSNVEIAGFYLKNYATKGGIIIADSTYGLNIHNNYFAMNLDTATNEPMIGPYIANTGGDAGGWSTVERNFLQSQSGGSATVAALIRFNSPATGVRICNNTLQIGDTNNTATVGIQNDSVKGIVSDNDFYASQTSSGAGVFTHCVSIGASGCAFGNRGNVADGIMVTGGTSQYSFVDNRNSANGGYGGGTANSSGGDEA